jgi:L-amino acid N-acyltransferase YncA
LKEGAKALMESILVTALRPEHWEGVREIYSEGIATGQATFETEVPDWASWDAAHRSLPRPAAHLGNQIVGWAALSLVSNRHVYRGVAEVSGIWTLQAGVFPDNLASLRLHQKFGFREVGVRERLGKVNGVWRDVILLERRSQDVGAGSPDEPPGHAPPR